MLPAAEAGRLAYLAGRGLRDNPFRGRKPEYRAWQEAYAIESSRRPRWVDDDLEPPPALRRPRPAPGAPLPPFVLADRHGRQRDWIMPNRDNSPEAIMARIDALIVNRDAPVTVWSGSPATQKVVFDNYAAFIDWYHPKLGRVIFPLNSQAANTDVLLEDYRPQAVAPAVKLQARRQAKPDLLRRFPESGASDPTTEPKAPSARRRAAAEPLGFVPPPTVDAPAPANAKFTRDGVTVSIDGAAPVPYRSARQAFTMLNLPAAQCRPFRKVLKQAGRLPFSHAGRSYDFVVVR